MILFFLTLSSWLSFSDNNTQTIQCNASRNGYESTQIEFTIPGFYLDTVVINRKSYSRISIPGVVDYMKKGYPRLPRIAKSIIVPDDKKMKLRIIQQEVERVGALPVMPSKGNILRNVSPSSIPYTFSDFYSSGDIFPVETAIISEPFIVRDFRGITVYVNPVRYDAQSKELIILKKLVVEVTSFGIAVSNIKKTVERRPISLSIRDVYKDFFLNYSESSLRYDMIEENAGRMIIICAEAYVSEMDSFLIWKRRKGIQADLYSLSVVGSDTVSIRSFIQNQYDSLGVTFCLLVGDGDEIPPPKGNVGLSIGRDADLLYAYTDGNDHYPDLFIGRFSSNGGDTNNIRNQVMRSIKYERNPEEGGDWYHRGLMVASDQSDDYDTITDKLRCEWLKDTLLYDISPYFTYTSIDSSYDLWGTSTIISSVINSGVSTINYIGHGTVNGWSSGGSFYRSNIALLTNYGMLPHVISVGCQVGNFNGRNCFSEDALTAGTPEDPAGFIVTLASTIDQTWVPPCIGQEGAVNLLAHYQANTAGSVYFNGLCYMIEQCGGDTSEIGVEMAQTWHIFGDPSIQLRTDTPRNFKVNRPSAIFRDSLVYEVTIYEEDSVTPVENAVVSFYGEGSSFVESGYTNSSGNYILLLDSNSFVSEECVYITVSHLNYKPYMDSISVSDFLISPESVEVNVPTEVEIITRGGLETRIDGYGFGGCDTTDDSGRVVINVNAPFGEDLQLSVKDASDSSVLYMRTLPVYGALELPAPYIQASCDTIGIYGGLMPGFPGRIIGSLDSSSFLMFLRGPGIDTSFSTSDDLLEYDLVIEETGEIEVTLGKIGYNIYQEIIPVRHYRGWLSGYMVCGSDSTSGIELKIYNTSADTSVVSPITTIASDSDGFYELDDSLLCGSYDVYAAGVGYRSELYQITVKNSSNDHNFNIFPDLYALNISTLISGNILKVKYSIPEAMGVEFFIYDATGRKISFESETNNAGWFTKDINLIDFSSGVYFLVMKAGNRIFSPEKFVLIR